MPCERVFSSGKETMTPRRNRTKPQLMEALQMLKFSFRHRGQHLNFTEGTSRIEELTLMEKDIHDASQVPEDFHSFVHSLAVNDPQEEPNSV